MKYAKEVDGRKCQRSNFGLVSKQMETLKSCSMLRIALAVKEKSETGFINVR
jgi:hypothetical protein